MYKIITVFLLSLRIIEYLPYYCFPETIYIYISAVDNKWFLSSVFSRKLFWTYIPHGKLCKYYIISLVYNRQWFSGGCSIPLFGKTCSIFAGIRVKSSYMTKTGWRTKLLEFRGVGRRWITGLNESARKNAGRIGRIHGRDWLIMCAVV